MTGPAYRVVARFFFEGPPRLDMAHKLPVNQAHRESEPLWRAFAVLLGGVVGIALLVTVVLAAVPQ